MRVEELFDQGADRYDRQRRKVMPCFNDFYQTVIDLVPFGDSQGFKFLDLGAGTGLLTEFILKTFPKATTPLIDLSEKMLEKAMGRFSSNERVSFLTQDYAHVQLPQGRDLIVSAMSIHHLTDQGEKLLFERVFEALNPEGVFINADLVKGETRSIDHVYHERWIGWIQKAGLDEEELSTDRMQLDQPSCLSAQLQWLKEAGFIDVDCYYKYYKFSVVSGKKDDRRTG
jgi:tRNA (cmo5U34)-methyltransferase